DCETRVGEHDARRLRRTGCLQQSLGTDRPEEPPCGRVELSRDSGGKRVARRGRDAGPNAATRSSVAGIEDEGAALVGIAVPRLRLVGSELRPEGAARARESM